MKNNQATRVTAKAVSSVLINAKPVFLLFALVLLLPAAARADSITLTTGTVAIQVPPGLTSISISNQGSFSLSYFNSEYYGPLVTSFGFQSITQGFGTVTFHGQTTQFFTGSLSFSDSLLTGQVTAFQTLEDAFNNNAFFTVTFNGAGFLGSTSPSHTFTVATPEPTTMLLLGSGLIAVGARARSKRREPPSS